MRKIFIIICVFCSLTSLADDNDKKNNKRLEQFTNRLDEGDKKSSTEKTKTATVKDGDILFRDTAVTSMQVKSFPDIKGYYSECYIKVVNKFGLWKGIGKPLSKEDLRHVRKYVKLLRPAWLPSTAPFTHMQVLNSFGNLDNESYAPYIANPFGNDNGISSSWESKLKKICQFEKICRGGVLVQENMYDEEGALVLQYIPMSVGKNHVLGHYTDAYGALAHLRKDEECTHVSIQLDENGYEYKVAFVNSKGMLKRNNDGVFYQLWSRDVNGNLIQTMSADAVGRPILDNWGNCGWQYRYDSNGYMTESTCINQYGEPIRMPQKRKGSTANQIRSRYTNDKWGNTLTQTFFDADWKPDTISSGIHRYIWERTLHGNSTSLRAEGLHGELVNYDDDIAMWKTRYDDQGFVILNVKYNKDGLLSKSGSCISRAKYHNNKKVLSEDYVTQNGVDTTLAYKYVSTQYCDTTINYDSEYINLDFYDSKHRLISEEYYHLDWTPYRYLSYHKRTTDYTDKPDYSLKVERFYGEDGLLLKLDSTTWRTYNVDSVLQDYAHKRSTEWECNGAQVVRKIEVDSITRLKVITKYNGEDIIDKFGQLMNEDFSHNDILLYYDSLGFQGRTFKADALYYQAGKSVNALGNNTSWRGINEFGEPSYVLTGDWSSAAIYCVNVLDDKYYYDEYGDTIPSTTEGRKNFKSSLYKAFCMELINQKAYDLGLRTGDIIVRYGDWNYPIPSKAGGYHENILSLEAVRKATTEKNIVVMRHDPQSRTSKLLQISLPKGTPTEIGFIYHMIYMTSKEHERYTKTVKKYRSNVDLEEKTTSLKETQRVDFIKPAKVGGTKAKSVFTGGFQDNAIVLAWEPYVNGKTFFFRVNDQYIDSENTFSNPYDSIVLHYTVDGHTAKRYTFYDDDFRKSVNRGYTSIPDASDIYAMADSLQKVFYESHPELPVILKPKQAAERLLALSAGVKEIEVDEQIYCGKGKTEFGDVRQAKNIKIDYSVLKYEEMFLARNILQNIDFSDYLYTTNDEYYSYMHRMKDGFDEACWLRKDGMIFLNGNLSMTDKELITFDVVDDGQFKEKGLSGKFIVLEFDTWHFGMNYKQLRDVIINSPSVVRKAKIASVTGEGDEITIGKTINCKFLNKKMGVQYKWELLPEGIYNEVLRRTK